VDRDDLENHVYHHGFKVRMLVEPLIYSTDEDQELLQASPFISATPDLLRALNHGRKLRDAGYQDVCLVTIDLWEMPCSSIPPGNASHFPLRARPDLCCTRETRRLSLPHNGPRTASLRMVNPAHSSLPELNWSL
jgi:hypothetical protein